MNQKGYTIPEIIAVVSIGFIFLVIATFIYQKNVQNLPVVKEKEPQIDSDVINQDPIVEEETYDYTFLEEKVKEAMEKYIEKNGHQKEETLITKTVEELNEVQAIENFVDPANEENECQGYGLYDVKKNSYKGYVRCTGNYATEGYNVEFE